MTYITVISTPPCNRYDTTILFGIELFDNSFFKTSVLNSYPFEVILSSFSKATTLFVAALITEKFATKKIKIAMVNAMLSDTKNDAFDENSHPPTATTTIV